MKAQATLTTIVFAVLIVGLLSFTFIGEGPNGLRSITGMAVAQITGDVVLNSTYGTNYTEENLTVSFTATDSVANITDWRKDGTSIAVLNLPFEAWSNSTHDENNWTKDYSTYGNDGTANSATWTSSGKIGGAYEFDGLARSITIPHDDSLNITTTLTVETWVKLAELNKNHPLIAKGQYTGTTYDLSIPSYNNKATFYLPTINSISSNATLAVDTWYHVVGTYDGSRLKIYLDGALENSIAATGDIDLTPTRITIGRQGTLPAYHLNGTIDEVKIYDITLSAEQIKANYEAGLAGLPVQKIVSQETTLGDTWSVAVTPNNGTEDGATVLSNDLLIEYNPYIQTCRDILGDSVLISNITSTRTCLEVIASNITIDCDGYSITGEGTENGINIDSYRDVTIKNCRIENYTHGIRSANEDNNTIFNNSVSDSTIGIYLQNSSGNVFYNNFVTNNLYGVFVYDKSNYNLMSNNIFSNNIHNGIRIQLNSTNNILSNNTFNNNGADIFTEGDHNNTLIIKQEENELVFADKFINITNINNIFINDSIIAVNTSAEPGLNLSARLTLRVDECGTHRIYYSEGFITNLSKAINDGQECTPTSTPACTNISCNNNKLSFDVDHFSTYAADSGNCGYVTQNLTLTQNLTSTGTCLNVIASDITIDCDSHSITGDGSMRGINVDSYSNITITNCIIDNYTQGIKLTNSDNNLIFANDISNSADKGIYLISSNDNYLAGNIIYDSGQGMSFENSSNCYLSYNYLILNSEGIFFSFGSENNTLSDTIFSSSTFMDIQTTTGKNNTLIMHSGDANITFKDKILNITAVSDNIFLGDIIVAVDSALEPSLNMSANITLSTAGCTGYIVYYYPLFTTDVMQVINYGQNCTNSTTPACTAINCTSNIFTFNVEGFSTYVATNITPSLIRVDDEGPSTTNKYIYANWSDVPDALKYWYQIKGDDNSIVSDWNSTTNRYANVTNLDLKDYIVYYYYVKAEYNDGFNSSAYNSDGILFNDNTPPTNLTVRSSNYTNNNQSLFVYWFAQDLESGIKYYEYAIGYSRWPNADYDDLVAWTNVGLNTNATAPLSLTNNQTYYASARARSNNTGSAMYAINSTHPILVDIDIPYGGYVNYTEGYETDNLTTVYVNAGNDSISGLASAQLKLINGTLSNDICNLGASVYDVGDLNISKTEVNVTTENGRCYTFLYYVLDKAGNSLSHTSTNVLKVDQTPPSNITSITDEGYVTIKPNELNATWPTSIDLESGIELYNYSVTINGTYEQGKPYFINWKTTPQPKIGEYFNESLDHDSTYYFNVRAKNRAGLHSNNITVSDGILYQDEIVPETSIASVEGDTIPPYIDINSNYSLTVINISGEKSMLCKAFTSDAPYYEVDGLDTFCTDSGTGNISTCEILTLTEGIYTRWISCRDEYGNGQNESQNLEVEWAVDRSGPNITLVFPPNNGRVGGIITFNSEISDWIGVDSAYYNITNASNILQSNGALNASNNWDTTFNTLGMHLNDSANYTFTVWSNDTLGRSSTEYINFIVDNRIPSLYMSLNDDDRFVKDKFNITFEAYYLFNLNYNITDLAGNVIQTDDNPSTTQRIALNWTQEINVTDSTTWSDGNHTIIGRAVNNAGNSTIVNETFVLDTLAPAYSGLTDTTGVVVNESLTVSSVWDDLYLNIVKLYYYMGGIWQTKTLSPMNDTYNYTIGEFVTNETVLWYFNASDIAGNINKTPTQNFTILYGVPILSSCTNLTSAGNYTLAQNISSTGTCINIQTSNVVLDCLGYTIEYGAAGGDYAYGINVAHSSNQELTNITIKNCIIQDTNSSGSYGYGTYLFNTTYSTIWNNTIKTNGTSNNVGINLDFSSNNTINYNNISAFGSNHNNMGIATDFYSNSNNLLSNSISTGGTSDNYGILLEGTSNNLLSNSISTGGTSNNFGILVDGNSNNVRSNTISTYGTDSYNFGILLEGDSNNITSNTISTGGTSNNFGILIDGNSNNVRSNTISTYGTDSNNFGILIDSNSNNITSNTISTGGTSNNFGILVDGNSNNVRSNTISTHGTDSYNFGILLEGDSNNITSNTISTGGTSNNFGILIDSNSNNVRSNTISTYGTDSNNFGILIDSNSNNITSNTISTGGTSNNYGILLEGTSNNVFSNSISTNGTDSYNFGILLGGDSNNITSNALSTMGASYNLGILVDSNSNNVRSNTISTHGTDSDNYGINLDGNSNNITSNTIHTMGTSNNYGILIGGILNNVFSNTISTDGTDTDNDGILIQRESNTLESNDITTTTSNAIGINVQSDHNVLKNNRVNASNETAYDWYSIGSSKNNTVSNLYLVRNDATISFTEFNTKIKAVTTSEASGLGEPANLTSFDKYLNISSTGAGAWINLSISYTDAEASNFVENTLSLWKYNGTGWTNETFYEAGSYGIDTTANNLYANISSFSIFGVFGTATPYVSPPSRRGGGGSSSTRDEGIGGAIIIPTIACEEKWECTQWSSCTAEESQIRTCVDHADCGNILNRPIERQNCEYEAPAPPKPPIPEVPAPLPPVVEKTLIEQIIDWIKENLNAVFYSVAALIVLIILISTTLAISRHVKGRAIIRPELKPTVLKPVDPNQHKEAYTKLKELEKYVFDALSKGFSKAEIKVKLIEHRWPSEIIEQLMKKI